MRTILLLLLIVTSVFAFLHNHLVPLHGKIVKTHRLGSSSGNFDETPDEYVIDPKDIEFANLQARARAKGLPDGVSLSDLSKLSQDRNLMRLLQEPKLQKMISESLDTSPEEVLKKFNKDPEALSLMQSLSEKLQSLMGKPKL